VLNPIDPSTRRVASPDPRNVPQVRRGGVTREISLRGEKEFAAATLDRSSNIPKLS
jgi:hypothetical protein